MLFRTTWRSHVRLQQVSASSEKLRGGAVCNFKWFTCRAQQLSCRMEPSQNHALLRRGANNSGLKCFKNAASSCNWKLPVTPRINQPRGSNFTHELLRSALRCGISTSNKRSVTLTHAGPCSSVASWRRGSSRSPATRFQQDTACSLQAFSAASISRAFPNQTEILGSTFAQLSLFSVLRRIEQRSLRQVCCTGRGLHRTYLVAHCRTSLCGLYAASHFSQTGKSTTWRRQRTCGRKVLWALWKLSNAPPSRGERARGMQRQHLQTALQREVAERQSFRISPKTKAMAKACSFRCGLVGMAPFGSSFDDLWFSSGFP